MGLRPSVLSQRRLRALSLALSGEAEVGPAPSTSKASWFRTGVCNKGGSNKQGSMETTELQIPLLQTHLRTLHVSQGSYYGFVGVIMTS